MGVTGIPLVGVPVVSFFWRSLWKEPKVCMSLTY